MICSEWHKAQCYVTDLTLEFERGRTMKIQIQKKPALTVAGLKEVVFDSAQCPGVWDKLFELHSVEALAKLGNGKSYGICFHTGEADRIQYMAAFDVSEEEIARGMGLEVVEIPGNEYAVVELKGEMPACIHAGWKYVMGVYFPEHGYAHSGAPDLEVYRDGDMQSPEYEMERWVPIKKA